ncbi:MAG: sugar phosphate isomerase/epimerase family protein [Bacteroidota bacterium]
MNLPKLCIHTITTKPWPIETAIKEYSKAGVKGITVWRDALQGRKIGECAQMARDNGLSIVSLCRGGFFPSVDLKKRRIAIEDNIKALDEASQLGAPLIVLVCGSDPGQSLEDSRKQIQDGIEELLPYAAAANIKLAIEPLHPMYADSRSAINTLAQANDMAEALNSPFIGVAVDVYHLWWDPQLETEIKRCGKNEHLFAFHICDWSVPTKDLLNDRGIMGDGCIPVKKIRGWVEETGFSGFNEVEIFSNHWWSQDQSVFLNKIIKAYQEKS